MPAHGQGSYDSSMRLPYVTLAWAPPPHRVIYCITRMRWVRVHLVTVRNNHICGKRAMGAGGGGDSNNHICEKNATYGCGWSYERKSNTYHNKGMRSSAPTEDCGESWLALGSVSMEHDLQSAEAFVASCAAANDGNVVVGSVGMCNVRTLHLAVEVKRHLVTI